jgi:hypothetical protein
MPKHQPSGEIERRLQQLQQTISRGDYTFLGLENNVQEIIDLVNNTHGDNVTVTFTRKQAEHVEELIYDRQSLNTRGTNFAAWRRLRRAMGTWKEPNNV